VRQKDTRDVRCPGCTRLLGRRTIDGSVEVRYSGRVGFVVLHSGAIACDCGMLVRVRQPDVLIVSTPAER
jgi:hypothetical protein